jgi:hypothetical protein
MKLQVCHIPIYALVFVAFVANGFGKSKSQAVTGGGGSPLTSKVTSMWAAVNEEAISGKQPLTYMIYFEGKEGWHKRKWASNQRLDSIPAVMEFSCDLTSLRALYYPKKRIVNIFGVDTKIDSANIILVRNVDLPGKEKVIKLGHVKIEPPEGANPAEWILELNPSFQFMVLQ